MKRLPWRDTGIWLVGDTHMHYRNVGLPRLAAESARRCGFIAVTSHGHRTEFFEAQAELVERVRSERPELVVINGIEWNTPVGKHATVMAPGAAEGAGVLRELIGRFDRRVAEAKGEGAFLAGLEFLGSAGAGGGDAVPTVIVNHPLSEPPFAARNVRDGMSRGGALVGFSGGGGHLGRRHLGGDAEANAWVSEVGGVYDALLSEGLSPVVLADGDFHLHASDGGGDFWPGEFTRSFVFCPERSEAGVFAGIRSGAAYFVLGPVVESLEFRASAGGESAMIGETLPAGGAPVEVTLALKGGGSVDAVEIIGDPSGEPGVVARGGRADLERTGDDLVFRAEVPPADRAYYLRARGCGRAVKPVVGEAGTMWFYTNALRVEPAARGG